MIPSATVHVYPTLTDLNVSSVNLQLISVTYSSVQYCGYFVVKSSIDVVTPSSFGSFEDNHGVQPGIHPAGVVETVTAVVSVTRVVVAVLVVVIVFVVVISIPWVVVIELDVVVSTCGVVVSAQ